jgi:heat shock protein HslJ
MVNSTFVMRATALLAVAFAYLSCDVMQAKAQTTPGSWVLQKGRGVQFPLARRPELQMQEQQLSGSTGCNAFTAKVSERAEKRIAIELLSLTRKLCGPKESGVENAIVSAFAETALLEQDGQTLAFLSASREPLLIWQRADSAPTTRSMQLKPHTRSHKHVHKHSPKRTLMHTHRRAHKHAHKHAYRGQSCCLPRLPICSILTGDGAWQGFRLAHHRLSAPELRHKRLARRRASR